LFFESIAELKSAGYQGFKKIDQLMLNECQDVPKVKGIYLVLNVNGKPSFLVNSVGRHFKNRNPTVSIEELELNWVDKSIVVYIGQAGGGRSGATLHYRIKQYIKFGMGKPVGHWGGRYIWQMVNYRDLILCWKQTHETNPKDIESDLLNNFVLKYCKRPFANLQD